MFTLRSALPVLVAGLTACTGTRALRLENDIGDLENDYDHNTELRWWLPEADAGPVARAYSRSTLVAALVGETAPDTEASVRLRLGQKMLVPVDISTPTPDPTDRPYAGWLHAGLAAERLTLDADPLRRSDRRASVELDLGVVGPSSLADHVMIEWHHFWELADPNGWDSQLKDEPALLFSVERDRRLGYGRVGEDHAWDLAGYFDWSLGSLRTKAALGGSARFGKDLARDFPLRSAPRGAGGGSLFAIGEVRYVLQDLFLDGNTWRAGPSVDKLPIVGDIGLGFEFDVLGVHLRLAHIWRSKEFEGQVGTRAVWVLDLGL